MEVQHPDGERPTWPWPDGTPDPEDIIHAYGKALDQRLELTFLIDEEKPETVLAVDIENQTAFSLLSLSGPCVNPKARGRLVAWLLNLARHLWVDAFKEANARKAERADQERE